VAWSWRSTLTGRRQRRCEWCLRAASLLPMLAVPDPCRRTRKGLPPPAARRCAVARIPLGTERQQQCFFLPYYTSLLSLTAPGRPSSSRPSCSPACGGPYTIIYFGIFKECSRLRPSSMTPPELFFLSCMTARLHACMLAGEKTFQQGGSSNSV
jgi:hypothetical protein